MTFAEGRILLFCRAPVPGEVKTRLASAIGNDAAARCHRLLASHCLHSVASARLAPLQLWCSPDTRHDFFARQQGRYPLSLHAQQGRDLGARMSRAFDAALTDADYALVIGSDCPLLTGEYLHRALGALREGAPAVLGPAEDGGYVMLGLRRNDGRLFENMPWGSDGVLEETRRRLGEDCVEMPPLWDVDRVEDLQRLCREAPGLPLSADLRAFLAAQSNAN